MSVYYDNHLNHASIGHERFDHNSTIQLTDAYRIYILKKKLVGCYLFPSQNASHCVHHAKRYYREIFCLVLVITVLKVSPSPAEVRCLHLSLRNEMQLDICPTAWLRGEFLRLIEG